MLNFGDPWGERRVNWTNGDYDHHACLLQFIRTGSAGASPCQSRYDVWTVQSLCP